MPRPKKNRALESVASLYSSFAKSFNQLLSLLVPGDWSRATLHDIVNTDERQDELIKTYIDSEIAKMNTTGVTAALIAGVISGSFSWYNTDNTTWPTKAAWYSGLVLSIASVASSAIHTAAFLRMKCDRHVTKRFKTTLARGQDREGLWKPHALIPYVLGGPTLHLKLAVLAFLLGLFYELWQAANANLAWHNDDLKIAFIVTLVGAFVVVNYVFSVRTLVHHSIHTKKEKKEGPSA
ncbi:MAG: hypothetical protein Q9174_006521 [Haloplaca sp. 1 TL-2023]